MPRSSRQRGGALTRAARRASAGGGVFQAGALARDVRRPSAATVALTCLSPPLSPSGDAVGSASDKGSPLPPRAPYSPAERAVVLSAREPHAAVRKRASRV